MIHALFAKHGSIVKVAHLLHQRGILAPRGGRVWSTDTLYRILTDETYVGVHYQNRYVVERTGDYTTNGKPRTNTKQRERDQWMAVEVPALVDPAVFAANQRRLTVNKNRAGRPSTLQTLLRSLFFCGGCGRRMVLQKGNGKPRYTCPRRSDSEVTRHGKERCDQVSPVVAEVDELVWREISSYLLKPELLHAFVVEQTERRSANGGQASLETTLRDAERALERARREFDRALGSDAGVNDEIRSALSRARQRHDEAARALRDHVPAPATPSLVDIRLLPAAFDPNTVDLEKRHEIVGALLERVVLSASGDALELEGVLSLRLDRPAKSFGGARR